MSRTIRLTVRIDRQNTTRHLRPRRPRGDDQRASTAPLAGAPKGAESMAAVFATSFAAVMVAIDTAVELPAVSELVTLDAWPQGRRPEARSDFTRVRRWPIATATSRRKPVRSLCWPAALGSRVDNAWCMLHAASNNAKSIRTNENVPLQRASSDLEVARTTSK